jgi:hypothetical protein
MRWERPVSAQWQARAYIRGPGTSTARALYDHNLLHSLDPYVIAAFQEYPGGNYASLAAWLASGQSQAATWEVNSVQADPQLANVAAHDYRPGNPTAATMGKNLASTGWPGAASALWVGAVDPDAATGLGDVGHRGIAGVAGNV